MLVWKYNESICCVYIVFILNTFMCYAVGWIIQTLPRLQDICMSTLCHSPHLSGIFWVFSVLPSVYPFTCSQSHHSQLCFIHSFLIHPLLISILPFYFIYLNGHLIPYTVWIWGCGKTPYWGSSLSLTKRTHTWGIIIGETIAIFTHFPRVCMCNY